jgi:hypothetical protein
MAQDSGNLGKMREETKGEILRMKTIVEERTEDESRGESRGEK